MFLLTSKGVEVEFRFSISCLQSFSQIFDVNSYGGYENMCHKNLCACLSAGCVFNLHLAKKKENAISIIIPAPQFVFDCELVIYKHFL